MKRHGFLPSIFLMLFVWLAILPASASEKIAAVPTPSAESPYHIMVNRQANTVTIYAVGADSECMEPVKAMICSVGRAGHETPTGTFSTTDRKKEWCYMFDGTYGQYSTQFHGNYLFHSICYTTPDSNALITEEYNMLGQPASLGCVRLQTEDAKWIFDNCPAGTPVTVYDSEIPGPLGKPERLVDFISPELDNGWDPTDPDPANPWLERIGVFILEQAVSLMVGDRYTLTAQITTYQNTLPELRWHSSDPNIVSVDETGMLIARGAGSAVVTVFCGNQQATVKVLVSGEVLPFWDVEPGSWYYHGVRFVYENQLFPNGSEQTFSPNTVMTREELARILYESTPNPKQISKLAPKFSDVSNTDSTFAMIQWVVEQGILPCVFEANFAPDTPLSRQEFISALYQYSIVQENTPTQPSVSSLDFYADARSIAPDAKDAMLWAIERGYLSGTETGNLMPCAEITRAQAATIFRQFWTNQPVFL